MLAGSSNAIFRAPGLRLIAVGLMAGVGLCACASSPETAATGMRPHPAAIRQASMSPTPWAAPAERGYAAYANAPATAQPPAGGGVYKLGAPYQTAGLWYVPADQPGYDETGIASWYGDQFDGQPTANNERFDMYSASAAHTTLPLPSIVEVTNLENGRVIRVRLNDRGPFKPGRIIDLSRAAADELGYLDKGTAQVRVRYIGPARLEGGTEPLYVAQAAGAPRLAAAFTQPARAPAAPSPRPAPVAAAVDAFAVQAGAYADRARADHIARTLSAAGAASVRPVEVAARQLYRVVVGPWRDERQAQAARTQVIALGYADARVIRAF